ncbi:MAG TPA: T9SS type A sorting domain-containing protein, partial [Bacteroidia bacterium]|nr:T9SS type A sorting domain-containing protein [Bacteroidia bacterium]
KQVVLEEFMQVSCSPCLWATPNLDAILRTCIGEGICNPIRYHVDWPGVDYMNDETDNRFVNHMVGFYNIGGVPDAMVDGTASYDPAYMNVSDIQTEATKGSPIKIDITSAIYSSTSNEYSATVRITSYTPLPAGLIVRAVLTVDTIKYDTDQSSEDPTYAFKPPIGTTASNGDPDTLYQYLLHFPNVAEDIMPSDTGAILSAFVTSRQTQILNLHWIKNHPWGLNPDSLHYDSLFPGEHLTVYVQTPTAIPALGLTTNYIYQSASVPFTNQIVTGIHPITNKVSLKLFPNPTQGSTTLQFNLNEAQNVTIGVYTMLGENLYTQKEGNMSAGLHQIIIPCMNLISGVYFVKFTSDNTTVTRKLVIQK